MTKEEMDEHLSAMSNDQLLSTFEKAKTDLVEAFENERNSEGMKPVLQQ